MFSFNAGMSSKPTAYWEPIADSSISRRTAADAEAGARMVAVRPQGKVNYRVPLFVTSDQPLKCGSHSQQSKERANPEVQLGQA
jgi:hypothetical protein